MSQIRNISKAQKVFRTRDFYAKYVRDKVERQYQELNIQLSKKGCNMTADMIYENWMDQSGKEIKEILEERDDIIDGLLESMTTEEYYEYVQMLGDVRKENEVARELELEKEAR